MNHETKEVILKVTDVVKTVVHFGFIPFVIYLGPDELNQIQQLEYRQKRLMDVLETMVRLAPRAVSPSTYSMDSDIFTSSPISSQDSITMALPEAEHEDQSPKNLLCESEDNQELDYCQPRVVIPETITATDNTQVPTSDLVSTDITTNERLSQADSLDTEDSEADVGSVSTKRQRLSEGTMKQNPEFIFGMSQLQSKLSKSSCSTYNKPQMERTSGQRKTLKFISYAIKTTAYPSVEAELRSTRVHRHNHQLRKTIAVHQTPAKHPHSRQQGARKYSNIVIEVPPRRLERKKKPKIVIEIPPWI
ncbi:hypothetical protein BGZ80_010982 [Entomortierella chlamydospora]|uniref:Uncharacterized protein n=1 Tax=Entomortierella chlamydospora TaxID=101097 RepID=A0A9P6MUV6_9FUNG|nr:hypothetical protein BGZ80_010982 [Entomortierella chlamydospora]